MNQCSFCGRSEEQAKKLIAGVSAFICDQCVALCSEVLAANGPTPSVKVGTKKSGTSRAKAGWSGYDPAPRDAS